MSIKFGLFADLHYSPSDSPAGNHGRRSLEDMHRGMKRFAQEGVHFVVNLGDNIQRANDVSEAGKCLRFMREKWSSYGIPVHNVLGNHEFEQLSLVQVQEDLGIAETYYSFDQDGCRFIILDTNYSPDDTHFSENDFDWKYSKLSEEELTWLEKQLSDRKRTFIFTHANLYFDPLLEASQYYQVMNKEKVWDIMEKAGCVEAVFQGHFHKYSYFRNQNIHYINVPSPTMTAAYNDTNFPIVEIWEKGFVYDGTYFKFTDTSD